MTRVGEGPKSECGVAPAFARKTEIFINKNSTLSAELTYFIISFTEMWILYSQPWFEVDTKSRIECTNLCGTFPMLLH
jgi:hypothetical protein